MGICLEVLTTALLDVIICSFINCSGTFLFAALLEKNSSFFCNSSSMVSYFSSSNIV